MLMAVYPFGEVETIETKNSDVGSTAKFEISYCGLFPREAEQRLNVYSPAAGRHAFPRGVSEP
jgi:hypothetical protein